MELRRRLGIGRFRDHREQGDADQVLGVDVGAPACQLASAQQELRSERDRRDAHLIESRLLVSSSEFPDCSGSEIRLQALESKALDTKPIWEQALVAIVEVKEGVYDIKRKFEIVTEDLIQVRADQRRVEKRMDTLEARPQ